MLETRIAGRSVSGVSPELTLRPSLSDDPQMRMAARNAPPCRRS